MKVEKITQFSANNHLKSRNVNLAGFGQSQSSESEQISSFNNKKSNEAIKSQFLANLSFEGHTDKVVLSTDVKRGPTQILSSSGRFIKELGPGESEYQYQNSNQYRVYKPVLSVVYNAQLERDRIRATGSSASYVVKEVITESPHYYNGSRIKENHPVSDNTYTKAEKTVYFSDPGERMDERTPYADYVVYAPGAYYKERSFWEKL